MAEPKEGYNSGISRVVSSGAIDSDGNYVDGGAAHVADVGRAAQSHNRHLSVVGNTVATDVSTATWTADEAVYKIRLKATAVTSSNLMRVVFDASPVDDPTDKTQAVNWLTAIAASVNSSTDVEYREFRAAAVLTGEVDPVAPNEWTDWIDFSEPLRRLDVIAVDVDEAVTVMVEVS